MEAELRKACAEICEPARIAADIEMIWYSPPIVFDRDCVGAVKQAAATAGYENMELVSGAGPDASYISRVAPTAMLFVPCAEGVRHHESESATPDDLAAGCNALAYALQEQRRTAQRR